MGQSKLDAAAEARPWLLLLCLAQAATAGVMQGRAQPDSNGFISIDCGFPGTTGYVDTTTTLSYAPDAAFTDAGENFNISAEYISPRLFRSNRDVRSFPDGARNCYTLRSLTPGNKYIIRAGFMYGNYDGLNRPPVFDLYIGVNFWATANISAPDITVVLEAIVVVPDNFVQVCLINTGSGTPFISGLNLRPLKTSLYPQVNASQGLVLLHRWNFGQIDGIVIRYPDDPHDRIWVPMFDATVWDVVSTTQRVQNFNNDRFEAPSKVMQTAITPRNASKNIAFFWDESLMQAKDQSSPGYMLIAHYSELKLLASSDVREFYIIQWTRQHLARGDIEGVLDARMRGDHDVNSVWKATEIALQCTAQASAQRPTMTDVVAQLQECLSLEEGHADDATESLYNGGSGDPSFSDNVHVADQSVDRSQRSNGFEIGAGPATR